MDNTKNPNEVPLKAPLTDSYPSTSGPMSPPSMATAAPSELVELLAYIRVQDKRLNLIEEMFSTISARQQEAQKSEAQQKENILKGAVLVGSGILAGLSMAAFGSAMKEARKQDMEQLKNDIRSELKNDK